MLLVVSFFARRLAAGPITVHRKEENAVWDQVEAKGACLRRLDERGFPQEMKALAEASDRFYELGVYYRNPLEVCTLRPTFDEMTRSEENYVTTKIVRRRCSGLVRWKFLSASSAGVHFGKQMVVMRWCSVHCYFANSLCENKCLRLRLICFSS